MTIGSTARRLLGPRLERVAADRYRRLFLDLDSLAATIAGLGSFNTVIEVGCGEGALLTRVMDALDPAASAVGIDIAPNPGHGYIGRNTNVVFRRVPVADVVSEGKRFDLVVVSDVLHHIPPADRVAFLESCRELLAPHGTIVVKEWVRRRNLAHLAAYTSDRYVSGDKGVQFYEEDELAVVFSDVFRAAGAPLITSHSRPHWNNVVLATTKVG
ncbi:MAG: class I SAM-dependent methyltransferase [Ilumatobacteraceae bacterium]